MPFFPVFFPNSNTLRTEVFSPDSLKGAIRCSFNTRFRARFRRVQKVPVQILRSGSGRFRRRRFWRRRFRCKYLGQVPEGFGADTEVRFRKVPVQNLGEVVWKIPGEVIW